MSKSQKSVQQHSSNGRIFDLDPTRVKPFVGQPRKRFRGIAALARSIQAVGQTTPILVTDCDDPDYDVELVDGERRLRACLLGKMKIRAILDSDKGANRYLRATAANFCRQKHDCVEVMEAIVALMNSGMSQAQIADAFGTTVAWVSQHASLRKLSPAVLEELKIPGDEKKQTRQERRRKGRVPFSVALLLVNLPQRKQLAMLRQIQARKMSMSQAKTFICRQAFVMGVRVGSRLSSYAKFKAVRAAVEGCSATVDRYLDMPGAEIGALIRAASTNEKRQLSMLLEGLCEKLLMLSDAVDGEKG